MKGLTHSRAVWSLVEVDNASRPAGESATGPDTEMGQAAEASVKFVSEHYRWLLLILPIYAVLAHGLAAAPLAAVLAIAVIAYNSMLALASRRSEAWVTSRALYLRCVEIGLICIGFSLLYVKRGSLDDHRFYYDGFYAIFVALAALTAGRKGLFWSATVATLAVGISQIMLTPSSPAFFSWDGTAYWISVALSVGTFGLYFIAIGLLAYLYTDFQLHRLGQSLHQRSSAEGPGANSGSQSCRASSPISVVASV